ncbi:DNTTIP1_dimer domain-containing protein [Meloidogyne graminicola]|uniref:DNTTIP1_dimer domain-containing protein n=1 Tax=Meloidogyne graminicola TaxID=189291 RepID=A0A8S9ZF99_9BILA|nr:DNTTIP1_dimer domain-containing protein [Meloidogyne graminicola]
MRNCDSEVVYVPGNCNGNKLNRRIEILENLLLASGDDTTAKTNSLRQALRRNKSDMADDTTKSLDVLRQVFQPDFNEEIKQVIDRHLRTTFTPAFENLRRNGHDVAEDDINKLCIAILDGAKTLFSSQPKEADEGQRKCVPAYTALMKHNLSEHQMQTEMSHLYDSDDNESDGSLISYNSSLQNVSGSLADRPKKRGRPKKIDLDTGRSGTPVMNGRQPITHVEALKWDPNRFSNDSSFVLISKLNKLLGFTSTRGHLLGKYPRLFRYVADEEDKAWLFQRNVTKRISGKVFLASLEDALEIAANEGAQTQVRSELQRVSFLVPDMLIQKIKTKMAKPFEQLKTRVILTSNQQQHHEIATMPHTFIPAFTI